MTGELIPTGVTFGVGRQSVNSAFSGTATFNNMTLDSGGNFSAGTGGGTITSGGTDLYNIFATEDTSDTTRVQPGTNITTGGTANEPIINLIDSPSVNNLSFSGRATGGDIYASNLTGGTIYSGASEMSDIIKSFSGTSGDLWSASTGSDSIIQNNNTGNEAAGIQSLVTGSGNTMNSFVVGDYSSIIGGVSNSMTFIGGSFISETSNSIIGGNFNEIRQSAGSAYRASIIGGNNNLLSSADAAIIGGSGNTLSFSNHSVILGGQSLNISKQNTAIMQRAHVDEYIDLEPQTSLPSPLQGRMFFSGGSLNRMLYNTGGTGSDWVIM